MLLIQIILQALIVGWVWRAASRDYVSGLALGAFFLVWLPHALRITIPGPVPEFTIHRMILLVLLIRGIVQGQFKQRFGSIPFIGLILFSLGSQAISCMFALDSALAAKRLFAAIFENFLFFIVLALTPKTPACALRILRWMVAGVVIAALLAAMQYYNLADPLHRLLPNHPYGNRGGVAGVFQHRIHQGFAMAMALPVVLSLLAFVAGRARLAVFSAVMIVAAGAYFGSSRGPWVAAALAIVLVIVLGPPYLKKAALGFILLGFVISLLRPGVSSTIVTRMASLFSNSEGAQEASADYRKVLWRAAVTETSKSPERFLFGYGGMSTTLLDITGYFGRKRGGHVMNQGFSSWDSEWAAHLVQYGWLGIASEILVRGAISLALLVACFRSTTPAVRGLLSGTLAGATVYGFAMIGVAMFSPQLKYMFCVLIGCGVVFIRPIDSTELAHGDEPATDNGLLNRITT